MPRQSKGARLWLRKSRAGTDGSARPALWFILDAGKQHSTGCGEGQRGEAEKRLADHITQKHRPETLGNRDPRQIPVADVIGIYASQIAPHTARPRETGARLERLLAFFGKRLLIDINGALCRAYVVFRKSKSAARRELQDLAAAIAHHRREGLCDKIIEVFLPGRESPRYRWLTRDEAARLIWAAWRYRERQRGKPTDKACRKHIVRFILVGLYTGTRAAAICGASFQPAIGRGHVDLERGVFYRRPEGQAETRKRTPPIRLPERLLAHMRRWHAHGLSSQAVVEWQGKPVGKINKAFAGAVADAGLQDVSPHTLRHTAATWLMQAGVSDHEACGYLGMTPETLRNYGHHSPDHMAGAIKGIVSRNKRAGK